MFQFIFDQALSNGLKGRLFRKFRSTVAKYYDPIVRTTLNGKCLNINFSHQLPLYMKLFPFYSQNLSRLAKFIRNQYSTLCMIDVGANVGDSFALVGKEEGDSILMVEGDPNYFDLLTRNTILDKNIFRIKAFLSDEHGTALHELQRIDGNTIIMVDNSKSKQTITYYKLDEILDKNPMFKTCNLLKIDTEGFDGKVIQGAKRLINESKPAIFFEHSPQFLRLLGEDKLSIFRFLSESGYNYFTFYDNMGYLVSTLSIHNIDTIADLLCHAEYRSSYFDVCCFHDNLSIDRWSFIDNERKYYSNYHESAKSDN
jgi:FkbM family methyltransferase